MSKLGVALISKRPSEARGDVGDESGESPHRKRIDCVLLGYLGGGLEEEVGLVDDLVVEGGEAAVVTWEMGVRVRTRK